MFPVCCLENPDVCGLGCSAICTAPFDIVKTRMQTQRMSGTHQYAGVRDAFRTIYREEGASAFVRGLGPRLLMLAPAASLTFACTTIWNAAQF